MKFIIYLFLRRLLPLNLTGWWLVKLKSPQHFNQYMIGFSFSYKIWTQLKKFLRWRSFIPKAPVLHQFHQFYDKYLCGPSCFKSSGSQSGKNSWSALQHNFRQEFKSWFTKYLNLIITNKSRYIHDFFESMNNNASSSAVIAYLNILIFWHFLW